MKKGLLLISGGIDSPAAGHLMQKKEYELIPVHFSNKKFVGKEPEKKAKKLSKKLGFEKLLLVDLSNAFKKIVEKCNRKYYFVLTKRLMFKIAQKIAKEKEIDFLVTGESLAQVSSQTLQNLFVIDKAVSILVLRPLIAYDKMEIVDLAKEIGTFEISKGPETCDVLGPNHPSTEADEKMIIKEEEKVNIENLIKKAKIKEESL